MSILKSLSLALIVSAFAVGGCAANGTTDTTGTTGGGTPDAGGNGAGPSAGGMGGGFNEGGNYPMGYPIVITPDAFELIVDENNVPTQPLTATINGQDVTGAVTWSMEKPLMGDVQGSEYVPSGGAGGVGTLTAVLGNSFGVATATVYVTKVIGAASIDPSAKAALDAPSGGVDPSMDWVYPFDETVYPLDVLGPELMWNGTQSADSYKLHIQETYFDYTEYFTAPLPARHLLEEAEWTNLSVSGNGAQSDPVSVSLGRHSAGTAYDPLERTWHIAQGKLKGVVYYWELPDQCGGANGRVLKIKPNEEQAVEFYQPGGCWGCHTVSRNGQKMFATLDSGFPFPQVTIDLDSDPATAGSITPAASLKGTFGAFNDKGDRIIVSNDDSSNGSKLLTIVDANNGGALAGNVMGTGCGEPAWSPDGTKIAAVCGLNGSGWIFDISTGYLSVADVAANGYTVSNQQTIVPQLGQPGRPAYPSFSPGSEYIAFGRPTEGSRSTGDGTLWLTDLTGTNVKPLKNANEGGKSFNPVFAPLRAGGYFWLVYISRRDYGNRLVGADRQQLWITAVQDPPVAEDPSSPPFYLRGQQDCGKSENAYFALEPCKEIGEECTSGVDCCNGNCLKDPDTGEYTCGMPSECAFDGNACEVAADCCNPNADCLDGFCTPPIPQ